MNPFDELKRVFHEPKRLAVVSALAAEAKGMTFSDLKNVCDLTDGNLNRHLRALALETIVQIDKRSAGSRPHTMVCLTDTGRTQFLDYLTALEEVLKQASRAMEGTQKSTFGAGLEVNVGLAH